MTAEDPREAAGSGVHQLHGGYPCHRYRYWCRYNRATPVTQFGHAVRARLDTPLVYTERTTSRRTGLLIGCCVDDIILPRMPTVEARV